MVREGIRLDRAAARRARAAKEADAVRNSMPGSGRGTRLRGGDLDGNGPGKGLAQDREPPLRQARGGVCRQFPVTERFASG